MQALFARCGDYFDLVYGRPAAPNEAEHQLAELPPGRTPADKLSVGFFTGDRELCGILDVVRGYRDAAEWYLGLLLFEPALRSSGHGTSVLSSLEDWARDEGATGIRLACAEQNLLGLRFWRKHEFVEDRRFPPRTLGNREAVLIEFVRRLDARMHVATCGGTLSPCEGIFAYGRRSVAASRSRRLLGVVPPPVRRSASSPLGRNDPGLLSKSGPPRR
ncbi:MAG: GNAT family N-acetyltransferase [Myxococcaceae bacterium]